MTDGRTEAVALGLLAIAEVPNFYSGLLPSLWTIGHFSQAQNKEARYWIRRGETYATLLSVTVGITTSYLSKSILPLVGVLLMSAALLFLYEHALQNGEGATYE